MMSFKAKVKKRDNVYISGTNSQGKQLVFWEKNFLGKILGYFGINERLDNITGRFTHTLKVSNMVVNSGLAGCAARVYDDAVVKKFNVLALGIGTTAAAVGQTALVSEITTGGGEKGTATMSRSTTTVANDTTNWSKTFTFTSSFAVTECAILNTDSIMLARVVFPALNVLNGYSLIFNWNIDNA